MLARIITQRSFNLGDDIQSFAACHLLQSLGVKIAGFVDREKLSKPVEPCIVLISAWMKFDREDWPPHKNITPVFMGFHTHQPDLFKHNEYMKRHSPIGCRDLATVSLCNDYGIDAYFSGCVTTTLCDYLPGPIDKDKLLFGVPTSGHSVLVDIGAHKHLRSLNAYYAGNSITTVSHQLDQEDGNYNPNMRIETAKALIQLYAAANLVMTTRFHAHIPSLAMGTDSVLVRDIDSRFGGYGGDPRETQQLTIQFIQELGKKFKRRLKHQLDEFKL